MNIFKRIKRFFVNTVKYPVFTDLHESREFIFSFGVSENDINRLSNESIICVANCIALGVDFILAEPGQRYLDDGKSVFILLRDI